MEIEISPPTRYRLAMLVGGTLLVLIVALAFFGRTITPTLAGTPVLLTSARWQSFNLARETKAEVALLVRDAKDLEGLLSAPHLEPVAAQLLAQRIYADHQATGTAVTLPARKALILAAQEVALAAAGSETKEQALAAYDAARERIELLDADSRPASSLEEISRSGALQVKAPRRAANLSLASQAPVTWIALG